MTGHDRTAAKSRVASEAARLVSTLSTCSKLRVGAVLVDESGRFLSSGFNGVPPGMPHCCDSGDGGSHSALFEIHAEVNALSACAWVPKPGQHSALHVTHTPCASCAKSIVAESRRLAIRSVVAESIYQDDDPKYGTLDDVRRILGSAGIELVIAGK